MFGVFEILWDLVILVALFGLTIFVHELGHFLAAIWSGLVVDVFSIGFGPAIWKKKVGNVLLKIGCIPLGGYVAIPQLDPAAMDSVQGKEGEKPRELPDVSPWKKVVVSLAGVTGNVLLALLLAWIIYWNPNVITEEGNTTIGAVEQSSAAYQAGLRPGDRIIAVNGEKVQTWTEYVMLCVFHGNSGNVSLQLESGDGIKEVELPAVDTELGIRQVEGIQKSFLCAVAEVLEGSAAEESGLRPNDIIREYDGEHVLSERHLISLIGERPDKPVEMVIEREGTKQAVNITPKFNEEEQRPMIGIRFGIVQGSSWMEYKRPFAQLKNDMWQIVRMLKALTTRGEAGSAAKGVRGPAFILLTLWIAIRTSFMNAIGLIRFININLAIFNLLPIPVLDGGHLVFAVWEIITRRKPHPKVVNTLFNFCFVLLICFFLFIIGRDFFDLPKFIRAFRGNTEQVEKQTPDQQVESPEK